jgi:serine phosphatase RsbU (regulator of sigma subunit)
LNESKLKLENEKVKLDEKVKKLWQQSITIHQEKEKINILKLEVEEKHRNVTESIEYARFIQKAILPTDAYIKKSISNSFILYLPKDIVAGDFYWMESVDDKIYFAACDCTGHGVPGAMVSVVCNTALTRSLNEFGERLPGKILDKTRELVLENFAKSDEEVKDGMDASLAMLDLSVNKLLWSGANNPLWIYHNTRNVIEEIKADKQPVGKSDHPKPFTTHEIQLQEGDVVYLFTDGYADQFGGDHNRKLTKLKFREKLLAIASLPLNEQREQLLAFHNNYKGNEQQIDDICVIGVRV